MAIENTGVHSSFEQEVPQLNQLREVPLVLDIHYYGQDSDKQALEHISEVSSHESLLPCPEAPRRLHLPLWKFQPYLLTEPVPLNEGILRLPCEDTLQCYPRCAEPKRRAGNAVGPIPNLVC